MCLHSIAEPAKCEQVVIASDSVYIACVSYRTVAWAWCSDLSAPSVTAAGYWGQARLTGHKATRGFKQGRQTSSFAPSRAHTLAKRPESSDSRAYFQVAWAWCSHISAASVTAAGYCGQARLTGHEAMQVQRFRGQQHSNKIFNNNLTEMFLINRTSVMNAFSTMDSHNQPFNWRPLPSTRQPTQWVPSTPNGAALTISSSKARAAAHGIANTSRRAYARSARAHTRTETHRHLESVRRTAQQN